MADPSQHTFTIEGTNQQITSLQLRRAVRGAGVSEMAEMGFIEALILRGRVPLDGVGAFVTAAHDSGVPLTEYVTSAGIILESELLPLLSTQHGGIPIFDPEAAQPDTEMLRRLDAARARELRATLVRRNPETGKLVVVVVDPADVHTRRTIPALLGVEPSELEWQLIGSQQLEDLITQAHEKQFERSTQRADVNIRASTASDSEAVQYVNRMLDAAIRIGASDVHLTPYSNGSLVVSFRVNSKLERYERPIPAWLRRGIVGRIKIMTGDAIAPDQQYRPQEGHASFPEEPEEPRVDLRITTLPTVHGEKVQLRLIQKRKSRIGIPNLGFEGVNEQRVLQVANMRHGAVFFSGPTGAGKSTTMYELLYTLSDSEWEQSILTIENPVEQRIDGLTQIQTNKVHGVDFAGALKFALRADPDIIMVGEVRDTETARTSLEAALTGHLMLSTVHANSALAIIDRLKTFETVSTFMIVAAVKMLCAQRLVRRLCTTCRTAVTYGVDDLKRANIPPYLLEKYAPAGTMQGFTHKKGGCGNCRGSGYNGRQGVHEVVLITKPLEQAIEKALQQGLSVEAACFDIAVAEGLVTLPDDGLAKVQRGETSLAELVRVVL